MRTRPVGAFTINPNSPQAKGLVLWVPLIRQLMPIDLISGKAGTVNGSPFFSPDGSNPSWQFNGTTEYISFTTPVTAVPLSLTCWAYQRSSATRTAISIVNSADTTNYFSLEFQSTPLFRARTSDGTVSSATASGAPAALTWHHLAGVFAATNSRAAYLNGGGKGTQTSSRTPTGINTVRIAALGGSTLSEWINGNVMDLRIYNRALADEEVAAIAHPVWRWDLFQDYNRIWSFNVGLKTATMSGAMTPAGVLGKQPNKVFAGSNTPAGAIVKQPKKLLAAALTPSGVNIKLVAKVLAGTVTSSGATVKQPKKAIGGSLSLSGTLIKPLISKILSGTSTPQGSTLKTTLRILAGTVNSSGDLSKQPKKILAGILTSAGTLARQPFKVFSGSVNSAGSLLKNPSKIFTGGLTASGALTYFRTILINLSGSLTPSGALLKTPVKLFSGLVTSAGTILRSPSKILSGSLTPSGALVAAKGLVTIAIGGVMTMSGAVIKNVTKLYVGTVSPSGSLLKTVNKVLAGTVTISGTLSVLHTVIIILTGVVTASGTLVKNPKKLFSGSVTSGGAILKTVTKAFSGSVGSTGTVVTQKITATLSGLQVLFKNMGRSLFKRMR